MHELSITQHLLGKVLEYASKHQAKSVNLINIKLGEFTGFVDDSIMFYWDEIAKDTIASNAKIIIERVAGKLVCKSCGKEIIDKADELCPYCNSFKLIHQGGDELIIDSIEITT